MKVVYSIANTIFQVEHKSLKVIELMKDYAISKWENIELEIEITSNEILEEKDRCGLNEHFCESLLVLRKISEYLFKNNKGGVFHSSAIKVGDNAILFCAPSGVGKSTHAKLWRSEFKDVETINDDKPFIKFENDEAFCYGSPWRGKHRLGENLKGKIKAICFINRSNEIKVEEISLEKALPKILNQMVRIYLDSKSVNSHLDFVLKMFESVKFYNVYVDMSPNSAIIVRKSVLGDI